MADTTNLADLPTDPSYGGSSGGDGQNIVIQSTNNTSYNPSAGIQQSNNNGHDAINEQKLMNEMVTGIQQASANGATRLPSRDIPTNTVHFADEHVKPNYVPQNEQNDYIQNTDTEQDILIRRTRNQNSRDSLEILYDEFQIPIIIALLYFIFQLPVVRSKVLSMLPSLFNKDGNPNLTGYIINSTFFGISYYVISKTLTHLQHV
jgi:hypothetical protein